MNALARRTWLLLVPELPSQPCPHARKGRRTDGEGRTLIYCLDCGSGLYYA